MPWAKLTPDLQEEGRLRPRATRKRKAEVAAEVVAAANGVAAGARRSARLAEGAYSVVMYESGERAIVRRGLKAGIEDGGMTAVQGRGGEQEQEALGGDGCMELEGGVIAGDSDDGA